MVEPSITPAMARLIEIWPTDRLVPYAKNARTHSPEQVAQIAASIVEFGFVNPILVDSMDGIIAGHGRLLAARKLGLAEVPVVVLGHLSEIQRRAYVIADNQLALNAGWNDELLRVALESLGADGFQPVAGGVLRRGTRHDSGRRRTGGCRRRRGRSGSRTSRAAGYDARGCVVDRTSPSDLWRLPGCRCRREVDGRRQCERGDHVAALRHPARVRPHQRVQADPAGGVRGVVPRGGRRHRGGPGAGRILLPEHQGARRRGRAESVRDGSGAGTPAPVGLAVRG